MTRVEESAPGELDDHFHAVESDLTDQQATVFAVSPSPALPGPPPAERAERMTGRWKCPSVAFAFALVAD